MKKEEIIRGELPNPAFARANWRSLNGDWDFAFDPEDKLQKQGIENVVFDKTICVPFCYESELSGINTDMPSKSVWYRRTLTATEAELSGSVLLHFHDVCVQFYRRLHHDGAPPGRSGRNTESSV